MAQYPALEGDASRALKEARELAFSRAAEKLGRDNTVITELLPEHLGGTANQSWGSLSIGTANSYSNLINRTVDNNKWIMINGLTQNEAVAEMELFRIQRGTAVVREYPINMVKNMEHQTFWASDPVIINENTNATLQFAARTTSTVAIFDIHGETYERRGVTINP